MGQPANPRLLKGIDATRVEKDESFPDAYAIYLQLAEAPHSRWVHTFHQAYNSVPSLLRREILVAGDTVRLVVHRADDLHQQIHYLAQAMRAADERVSASVHALEATAVSHGADIVTLREKLEHINRQFGFVCDSTDD